MKVALCISAALQCLGLGLGLLSASRSCLTNLCFQILRKHLKCVPCVGLLLFKIGALVFKLACKLGEHIHDALCLELICVGLWCCNSQILIIWVLCKEGV